MLVVLSRLPGGLELCRRQRAQGRVNALALVDVIEELASVRIRIGEILVVGQIHLLLFAGAHQPLGVPVLAWLADLGHTDAHPELLKTRHVGRRGLLNALVGVVKLRDVALLQRPLQCG